MSDKLRAYLALHFCVLIWGFTAILGKLISLQALPLVWWRVVLCCAALLLLVPRRQYKDIGTRRYLYMLGIGMLVGTHWLCFYGAIKLSNASVAVATMATTSFFAALVEPALLRQSVKWYELALGILILPGIALILGNLDWGMQTGFALGILGALLAAVFSTLNKKMIDHHPPPPLLMSLVELGGGVLICSLAMPFLWLNNPETRIMPQAGDWLWLWLLAGVCTLLPYYLTLLAMRHISAFGANLTINLEPVYGVFLAALFFREDKELSPNFYVGVSIILLAVFSHPFLKNYFDPPAKTSRT
ncbi:MAG: EamA family transporter [Saprospiraceae bacterium]|nr:EamA family transporter [Saprospiraceae bacterium]